MLYSSLLAYTLAVLFYPTVTLFSYPIAPGKAALVALLATVCFSAYEYFKNHSLPQLRAEPFAVMISLLFISSLVGAGYTLFSEDSYKYLILMVGASAFAVKQFFKIEVFSIRFLILAQLLISAAFLTYTRDSLIFSDDHPSFLYRFQLLKEHFPYIPFYNAQWNAGYSAREFFASGMLNVFFVAAPIIYLLADPDILNVYNLLIPYLYILVVPWSVYAAGILLGYQKQTAVLAALLSLAPSLGFFEWLLRYGTLGFAFSIGMAPLTYALIVKLVFSREIPSWAVVFGLIIVSFLLISWSLSGLIFVPAAILTFVKLGLERDGARFKKVCRFALLFALVNGPWIKVFIEESKVFSFVQGSSMPGSEVSNTPEKKVAAVSSNQTKAIKHLKFSRNKIHPLIVVLFIPALAFAIGAWSRGVLVATIIWLIFVSYAGEIYKPQLELKRMLLPAAFLLCIPVSEFILWIRERLEENLTRFSFKEGASIKIISLAGLFSLYGITIFTPLLAASAYSNRTSENFVLEPVEFRALARAMNEHAGEGRTFFSGFVLHELGSKTRLSQDGGHIAPLAFMSGKPLYASDFYHAKWSTVDPIPASYRKRQGEGIEEFFDLVNVTNVLTAKPDWVKYLESNPRYIEVFRGQRFRMFIRQVENPSYFLKGDGEVKHLGDGLEVIAKSKEIVLKFRSLPKLSPYPSSLGVRLERYFAFEEEVGKSKTQEVHFIKLIVPEELIHSKKPIKLSYWQ